MSDNQNRYTKQRDELLGQLSVFDSKMARIQTEETPEIEGLTDSYLNIRTTLDTKLRDLKQKEFRIAFAGGFNSGKSTLINAIIGDYILPEANKPTTCLPTFIRRASSNADKYDVCYLTRSDFQYTQRLYRLRMASDLGVRSLAEAGNEKIIQAYERAIETSKDVEGTTTSLDRNLLDHFKRLINNGSRYEEKLKDESNITPCSREKAFALIQDDLEASFIDRIDIYLQDLNIPPDVVIVDLPGVSVPNPRHQQVTREFIQNSAHAVVLVLASKKIRDKDEDEILRSYLDSGSNIFEKLFLVINQWDLLTAPEIKQTEECISELVHAFQIEYPRIYKTAARNGLIAYLHMERPTRLSETPVCDHVPDYLSVVGSKYSGNHRTAYEFSKVDSIRTDILNYLNNDIKPTTLKSAALDVKNCITPVLAKLQKSRDLTEDYLSSRIDSDRRSKKQDILKEKKDAIIGKAREVLTSIQNQVIDRQHNLETTSFNELWHHIHGKYEDNLQLKHEFRNILAQSARQSPLYFEIETKQLTSINKVVKGEFARLQQEGARRIFDEYEKSLAELSDFVSQQFGHQYLAEFDKAWRDVVVNSNREKVRTSIEDHANLVMSKLDSLMVWRSGTEEDLFQKLGIQAWEEAMATVGGIGEGIRADCGKFDEELKELLTIPSAKFTIGGKLRKDAVQDLDNGITKTVQAFLTNILQKVEDSQAAQKKVETLLDYAFPRNPTECHQLTAIARLVPGNINDDAMWDRKARLFQQFFENVYKGHMETVITELNNAAWAFVRDRIAQTQEDLDNILERHVFGKLEEIAERSVDEEFGQKRSRLQKSQDLIDIHLKPLREMEQWLAGFMEQVRSA